MTVCIIPARGGSKRFPRKNLIKIDGIPILGRTVTIARQAGVFSAIIVSTDDDEALDIAEHFGAVAYKRPSALGSDEASVVSVCKDVLNNFKITNGDFCCLYATASLLKPQTLKASQAMFSNDLEAYVLMGVSEFNFPPVQSLQLDDQGWASLLMPEFKGLRSQLHPRTCVSNGTFYWGRVQRFQQELTFYSKRLKVFKVDDNEVCDLDYPEDLEDYMRKLKMRPKSEIES